MLGPLQLRGDTAWTGIRAPQPRLVLAVLLAEAGQIVTTDRLIDELWAEKPPRSATGMVQVYVMRLRRMLNGSPVALLTRGHGYQLLADDGAVDASLFERAAEMGRRSLAVGKTGHGVGQLAEALGLWRGRPFADVPTTHTITAAAERLEQIRLTATEDRLKGALDLGRHANVIDELSELVDAHPFRERMQGLLMTALYRCGRRAEAVAAYHRARNTLVAELGLEPGNELRRLHQAILTDSPDLAAPIDETNRGSAAKPRESAHLNHQAPHADLWVDRAWYGDDGIGFVGRDAELALLDSAVEGGATVVAIDGMAGVGKTALALQWSHRARDRFPDGRLYVNLDGHGSAPPPGSIERLGGRRALVLLDHVHNAEQVGPLLAEVSGCVFVVTSRAPLKYPFDQSRSIRMQLDPLSPDDAIQLLEHLVGAVRISSEHQAAEELARACAYLPLALRAAAIGVVGNPCRAIADYARDLVVTAPR